MNLSDFNKNIHIKDYLSILRRRKWIFISFFFITVTTITIATFVQQKTYRATATVIVDVESPDIISMKDVVKLGESNYFAYRDYIETQKEIIRSRRTAYYVMKNLDLKDKEEFKKVEDPISALLKKMSVELIKDTRILKIHVDDGDPKEAYRMANEFAKVYAESNIALKMKTAEDAQDWLKKEVEKQRKKVREAELKLQAYKEDNDIVSIENQQAITNDALVRLNTSFLEAQRNRIRAETAYKGIINGQGNMDEEKLPTLLTDNQSLQQLKDDYLKQKALLTEYRKVYKHKHPKMIRLLESINYLNMSIKGEIETEYKHALDEESKFKAAFAEQKRKALELERKIINYNALKREVETNQRILDIVLNRLKETSIVSQIQTNNVRVQDLAEIPKKPIKPKKRVNIAMAIILGLIGGAGLAFFREYMDTTLKSPEEISDLLKLPILGSVPKIKRDGVNIKRKEDVDQVVAHDTHSMATEAYRSIRTNLLFSINHSSSSKSIVITSSVPREGKTITAVNLATIIATGGESVLLVDADMRRPRVHSVFNDSNETGLSQFLMGEAEFENIVKKSGVDNLSLVTAGNISHKPAELISSERMKLFLEKASSRFSKIIIDTPPITLVTDAAILSTNCTGVILVTEGGRTTVDTVTRSKELLEKVDAKLLGVIVNNISLTKDIYSYPHYYYKSYYKPA